MPSFLVYFIIIFLWLFSVERVGGIKFLIMVLRGRFLIFRLCLTNWNEWELCLNDSLLILPIGSLALNNCLLSRQR